MCRESVQVELRTSAGSGPVARSEGARAPRTQETTARARAAAINHGSKAKKLSGLNGKSGSTGGQGAIGRPREDAGAEETDDTGRQTDHRGLGHEQQPDIAPARTHRPHDADLAPPDHDQQREDVHHVERRDGENHDPDQTHDGQQHGHEERGPAGAAVADLETESLDGLDDPGDGLLRGALDHRRVVAVGGACRGRARG